MPNNQNNEPGYWISRSFMKDKNLSWKTKCIFIQIKDLISKKEITPPTKEDFFSSYLARNKEIISKKLELNPGEILDVANELSLYLDDLMIEAIAFAVKESKEKK